MNVRKNGRHCKKGCCIKKFILTSLKTYSDLLTNYANLVYKGLQQGCESKERVGLTAVFDGAHESKGARSVNVKGWNTVPVTG